MQKREIPLVFIVFLALIMWSLAWRMKQASLAEQTYNKQFEQEVAISLGK